MKSEIKKSIGYKRYLVMDCWGEVIVLLRFETDLGEEDGNEILQWIDTEWQYEEYEE